MSRAERRRETQRVESPAAMPWTAPFPLQDALWWILLAIVVFMTARATVHRITWYLAVDQFGYLTFAGDLLQGRITHEWSVAKALAGVLPAQTDMLAQTYIYDAGRMYCRYAPGFPILLAGWMGLFGTFSAHYLNPTLYVVFICVYVTVASRLLGDRWRGLVALCLLLLLPTFSHLWGLTITRDLSAHLFGWLGLLGVLPPPGRALSARRLALAGLMIGICSSIRPDDIMYALPVLLLAMSRWRRDATPGAVIRTAMGAGALAGFCGLLPFFAYNWAATGNPLWPTQGMEVNQILKPIPQFQVEPRPAPVAAPPTTGKVGYPSPGWHGGTLNQVQGGGLRLANLPTTLPGLFAMLNRGYGPAFMGLAIWGLVLGLLQRPLLIQAGVPYAICALLLYGCWSRPDGRYVLGVHYFMPLMIAEALFGTYDLRELFGGPDGTAQTGWSVVALVGAALFAAMALFTPTPVGLQASTLPILTGWMVLPGMALGLVLAFLWPTRVVGSVVACGLGVVLSGYVVQQMSVALARPSAGFQRAEMERARATLQSKLPPNSVVLSTEDIGRPMENIQFYSGVAQSIYWTDIVRWGLPVQALVPELTKAGMHLYWLMPAADTAAVRNHMREAAQVVNIDKVLSIPPAQAMDWFVAASFHRGLPLELYKITPKTP